MRLPVLVISVFLLTAATYSQADLIVSTLPSTPGSTTGRVYIGSWIGMEFTTDATDYNAVSATLRMGTSGTQDSGSAIDVSLYNDNAGLPGNVLHTLTGPASPVSGDFVYSALPAVTLSGNTTYHLIARVTGGTGEYAWPSTFLGTFASSGPGTIANVRESSTDSGTSWAEFANFGVLFSVDGTPVPEPGTASLLTVGSLFVFSRRRKS